MMAIRLTEAVRVAGTELAAGTMQYLHPSLEAELVAAKRAEFIPLWPRPLIRGLSGGDGFSYQPWRPTVEPVPIRLAADLTNWTLGNSGTAATATVDPASPFGVPAIRLDIPNGNTYAQLTCAGLTIPGFATAAGQVCWMFAVEDATIISQVQSLIGDSGFGSSDTVTYHLAGSTHHNKNGVHVFQHAKTLAFSVTDIRLRMFGGSVPAGRTGRIWVLGAFIPRPTKPFLVISFDDAEVSWHTRVLPELRARGVHATFGLMCGVLGTNDGLYVNDAKVHEIYAAGNDVGNHNVTNTALGTYSLSQYLDEFDTCARYLKSRGWERGRRYHPFVQGLHSPALCDALAARGVTVMRNATEAVTFVREKAFFGAPILLNKQTSLDNTTTLAQAKAQLDEAITYSHDSVAMGHILAAAAAAATWAQSDFAAYLDYAIGKVHAGLLEGVGSVSEWAALRGVPFWD